MPIAPSPLPARTDPRVLRTRGLLEDAMRGLMRERPCSAISVAEVAARATVNRATFYAHFDDLRHLAATILRGDLERAMRARTPVGTPFDATSVAALGTTVFEFFDGFFRISPRTVAEKDVIIANTLQETLAAFLAGWRAEDPRARDAFPGVPSETVTTTLAWALYGGATRWCDLAPRPSAATAARDVVSLIVR